MREKTVMFCYCTTKWDNYFTVCFACFSRHLSHRKSTKTIRT